MVPEPNETYCDKLLKLPISRIRKIAKLDPDVGITSQEALFLITKATELLLESLARESYEFTASESKKVLTKKHVEAAVNNIDALAFLDGTID